MPATRWPRSEPRLHSNRQAAQRESGPLVGSIANAVEHGQEIIPDVDLGAHTASLGLSFYTSDQFPAEYLNGAFIGQHGSWNRSDFAGYKVVFVPFENGKPQKPEDFLTGFISSEEKKEVFGRPAGVFVTSRGSLLVADDAGNTIWKVVSAKR